MTDQWSRPYYCSAAALSGQRAPTHTQTDHQSCYTTVRVDGVIHVVVSGWAQQTGAQTTGNARHWRNHAQYILVYCRDARCGHTHGADIKQQTRVVCFVVKFRGLACLWHSMAEKRDLFFQKDAKSCYHKNRHKWQTRAFLKIFNGCCAKRKSHRL